MPDHPPGAASSEPCRLCAGLLPEEYAFQKYGWPENDTTLPGAAAPLSSPSPWPPRFSHQSRSSSASPGPSIAFGRFEICPKCGHASPSAMQRKEEQSSQIPPLK